LAADQNGFLVPSRSLEKQVLEQADHARVEVPSARDQAPILSPEKQVLEQQHEARTANARRQAQTNAQQYQAPVMIKINILALTASNLVNAPAQGTLYVVRVALV